MGKKKVMPKEEQVDKFPAKTIVLVVAVDPALEPKHGDRMFNFLKFMTDWNEINPGNIKHAVIKVRKAIIKQFAVIGTCYNKHASSGIPKDRLCQRVLKDVKLQLGQGDLRITSCRN